MLTLEEKGIGCVSGEMCPRNFRRGGEPGPGREGPLILERQGTNVAQEREP